VGVGKITASDLDALVRECDRLGGLGSQATRAFLSDLDLQIETVVDQALDPFGEEYFQQQVDVYREIAGRDLDQSKGEQCPVDVETNVLACNPYNNSDIRFIAKHARTIQTCLALADLPPGASVLDMGCGWGLSSEVMAFAGARVTAVDINPSFVELVGRRATRLGLPIEAIVSEFDTYVDSRQYDLLFFYECLHHSLKPWETIARLAPLVKPHGKIVWAGEPVNDYWWRNWGLRLDCDSIYCMRKFGWWESGWTADFLTRCFARSGFEQTVFPDIGLDNGHVGFAVRSEYAEQIRPDLTVAKASASGAQLLRREIDDLHSHIAGMTSSLSWKASSPIRVMGQLARRLYGR